MSHHSALKQQALVPQPDARQVEASLIESCQELVGPLPRRKRGRPTRLVGLHLCLGIMLCGLRGFGAQLGLWRLLCLERVGPFEPVQVGDQAVYNRVDRAAEQMAHFFTQVSRWMCQQVASWQDRTLAPFATQVLALDESTLDVVGRWLASVRGDKQGDPHLLAGRISALFDVRLQQWVRVDVLREASANCKQHAVEMLSEVRAGVLLLFDRGYLSFPWFDELSQRGLWWISRYSHRVSYQVRHVLYQGDGVLDVIIWLGAYRADRAKYAVRLVQFYQHGHLYRYLTNVLDPQLLPVADIARLYARRWDIEMAFRVLKDYLGIAQMWSAKWSVIGVQVWCGLLLAQMFHGLQMQLAAQAGVEPFDVSIDLLVKVVPRLLEQGRAVLPTLLRQGRDLLIIRPSTRVQVEVPWVDPGWITPAPAEALEPRPAPRYARRKCAPGPRPKTKKEPNR